MFCRELIETIADFEEREFAGTTRDTDFNSVLKKMKLAPINESGGAALLHMVCFFFPLSSFLLFLRNCIMYTYKIFLKTPKIARCQMVALSIHWIWLTWWIFFPVLENWRIRKRKSQTLWAKNAARKAGQIFRRNSKSSLSLIIGTVLWNL